MSGEGHVIDYEGSWWVDDKGRRCWVNERVRSPVPACVYFYRLDGRYYASESDTADKSARLEGRRINK
jgi:hypothetical protein